MSGDITINEAIQQVLDSMDGAMPVKDFYQKVLTIRPSSAKNPTASIRGKLSYEWSNRLVRVNRELVVPARLVMQGVRWAVPVSQLEVERGVLRIFPTFTGFVGHRTSPENIKLFDEQGHSLEVPLVSFMEEFDTPFGVQESSSKGLELVEWFLHHEVEPGDYVLIIVEDWERKHFSIVYEPAQRRQQRREEVTAKNQELADLLFQMLESAQNEDVMAYRVLPIAYAQMQNPHGYPGDHWEAVVKQDPRMTFNGWLIHYSDAAPSFMDMLLEQWEEPEPKTSVALSAEQAASVYRFRAAFEYRKGLWREIEIQGGQTLADFNQILVSAFKHEWDHLGGFWKRVRRGSGRRFREVDLGNVDPLGGGDGADTMIASIELQPGDSLKYVYDFGDWIEHIITLEAIVEMEDGAEYPRVVAQNRVRHRYCQECKAEGRKTVATWICIQCSNEKQREVLLCEDCLDKEHEDHYAEEVLY